MRSFPVDDQSAKVSEARFAAVNTWTARFSTGPRSVPREYIFARVELDDGTVGSAYALTRGMAVASVITTNFAHALVGLPVADGVQRVRDVRRDLNQHGCEELFSRSMSMLDIAIIDAWSKHLGMPAYQLLGPGRVDESLPVLRCVVHHPHETIDEFVGRVAESEGARYSALKMAAPAQLDDADKTLGALRDRLPDVQLAVDGHWQYQDLAEATAFGRIADRYNLAWLEDPFPRDANLGDLRRLGEVISTPVAFGDEVFSRSDIARLRDEPLVHVLRLCVSTMGGLSGAADLAAATVAPVISPHVHAEASQHLAFAFPAANFIEMYPEDGTSDGSPSFVDPSTRLVPVDGRLPVPTKPGLGLDIDWECVVAHQVSGPGAAL